MKTFRVYTIIILVAIIIALYTFESYIRITNSKKTSEINNSNFLKEKIYKEKTGKQYDFRTNVQIAEVIDDSTIKVKVWERGSGLTMASGSSACAVAFSAKRLNLTKDEVQIILDGGSVNVKCQEDGVWISGNIEYVFSGKISSLLFDKSE